VARSRLTVEVAIGDPELAERVRDVLTACRGFGVVATEDGRTPDVLVTDAADEVTEEMADGLAEVVPVLVLADDASKAAEALRVGAMAVLSAAVGAEVLCTAVRAAALGLTTLPAELRDILFRETGRYRVEGEDGTPAAGLTARELQVLQLLAEGASNKAIARRLGITPHTAKFHVAAIAGKLGASGRTDAVAKAMRLGLVMV
jgi:two-component system, NarL family, nitrate/nitrite response regulator NarL